MNKKSYKIKGQVSYKEQDSIPLIEPDHVSLGKCATCQQFQRRYASTTDPEVIEILRDGYAYLGFKKVFIESLEEEGFANMHHVIRIRSKNSNVYKEICIQRQSEVGLKPSLIKDRPTALTDLNSVVIITYNLNNSLEFFVFNRHTSFKYTCDFLDENIYAVLCNDKLFFFLQSIIKAFNFESDHVTVKIFQLTSHKHVLALSSEMLLFTVNENDTLPTLYFDSLKEKEDPTAVKLVTDETFMQAPLSSQVYVFSYRRTNYLVYCDNDYFKVYYFTKSNELIFLVEFRLDGIFPDDRNFTFEMFYYNRTTKQMFLMYRIDRSGEVTRYILILDVRTRTFVSILQMEMALMKIHDFQMCPSRDGTQLFVPQSYDNKVIFYHVFTLIPNELHLENIVSLYIRKHFTEEEIISANIPRYLKDELLG